MNSFVRDVLRTVLALFIAFCALAILVVVLVGVAGMAAKPRVPAKAVLVLDLSAPITESARSAPLDALMGDGVFPLPAHDIVLALREAARDRRVQAVFLRGDVQGSLGALNAVRGALAEVRAAGKRVVAYPGSADERVLWFTSVADEIWLEPLGMVEFDGWVAEIPYFGDGLRQFGIEIQVTRAGKYKSAGEPFMLGQISPENREQMEALLAVIEQDALAAIATGRGLSVDDLRRFTVERGWFRAREALEAGLVTHVAPFADLLASLHALVGTEPGDELPQITLTEYAAAIAKEPARGDGVRVVVADGEIVDGSSATGIGGDDLAAELREARLDDSVRAVVMRVDSPGGSATASDVIRSEVRALRAAGKPVIVSMGSLAASGGYWISADADRIVAEPTTVTGSIGVFGMVPNFEALAERFGVRAAQIRTSPLGGADSMWKSKTPEQLGLVQDVVDEIYDRFLDLVAEGRGMERDAVHEIAQGRVWSGMHARELGLVDELGGLDRAIAIAREKAGLAADAPVHYPVLERQWIELLLEAIGGEPERIARSRQTRASLRTLGALERAVERLERAGGPVHARLPFDWMPR